MKTKLDAAIDHICSGTITRECDALERLGSLTDDARLVVDAYSDAQARIGRLDKALRDIIRHYEMMGGNAAKLSSVVCIAVNALADDIEL